MIEHIKDPISRVLEMVEYDKALEDAAVMLENKTWPILYGPQGITKLADAIRGMKKTIGG